MRGYLEFVCAQELLRGGRALHADRRAAGDDDRGAGEHLCGDQAHAVAHGSQILRVTQSRV